MFAAANMAINQPASASLLAAAAVLGETAVSGQVVPVRFLEAWPPHFELQLLSVSSFS